MAEAADIASVMDLLPEDSGWDEAKVTVYLDAGRSVPTILQQFWDTRAAKYSTAIDVSESGSTRSLSRLYDNAIKQSEYWASRVALDKAEAEKAANNHASVYMAERI